MAPKKAPTQHPDRHKGLQPLINATLWLTTPSADVVFNDTSHQNTSVWMDRRLGGAGGERKEKQNGYQGSRASARATTVFPTPLA